MHTSVKIRPVNSLIFIADVGGGDVPEWIRDRQILSTPSCISVLCYPEQDGPTEVSIGKAIEVDSKLQLAFTGVLETPNRTVVVTTIDLGVVLEARVAEVHTPVTIWVNHPRWADKVVIDVGQR